MRIGIDLGGTKLLIGLVDDNGAVTGLHVENSKAGGSKQAVIDQLVDLIDRGFTKEVNLIGVGVPAIVDSEKGIVYNAVSIPSWDEVPLKQILESKFGVPVQVNNDCNCFARGVLQSRAHSEYDDLVCITLGTGVGSGLIFNRHLYTGKDSLAGEIGSIPYLDKDYEYYCSSRFFLSKGTTGQEAGDKASAGDSEALELWKEYGSHLGDLLQTVLFAYNPQAIVFGGSITNAFRFFKDSMDRRLSEFPYHTIVEKLALFTVDTQLTMITGATYAEDVSH